MNFCVTLVVSVFLLCYHVSVEAQGCTTDSCLNDFTTEFDRLESLLESDVGLMAYSVKKNSEATSEMKSCAGITDNPNSKPPGPGSTKPMSTRSGVVSQPSWHDGTTINPSGHPWITTVAPGNGTTESSGVSTRVVIAVSIAAGFGCLLLIGLVWFCSSSSASAQAGNAAAGLGMGQYPPVQSKNPYEYQNRSFVPNFYT